MATMMMTAATPKMMPNAVRRLRSLCRRRFFSARRKVSRRKMSIGKVTGYWILDTGCAHALSRMLDTPSIEYQVSSSSSLYARNHLLQDHRQADSGQDRVRGRAVHRDPRHPAGGAGAHPGDPEETHRHAQRPRTRRRGAGGGPFPA